MNYISRDIDSELLLWKEDTHRKPLLLRGARQVGKTSTVREFAKHFDFFIELDLNGSAIERQLFESDISTPALWENLAAMYSIPNQSKNTLLFIDEIQACPAAINRLRYFYEQVPHLHVIAAGSLLEFVLQDLPSFGVGRIRSLYLYPLSFSEFLRANGQQGLDRLIKQASPNQPLLDPMHNLALQHLKIFLVIGGMPEVVSEYVRTHDLYRCQQVLDDLIISYRDDFKKYHQRIPEARINETFLSVAQQAQGKFVYSRVGENLRAQSVKDALQTLILAGLVYPITHTSANGIPLGSEVNEKYRRMIMMDTGFIQRILHLDLKELLVLNDFEAINKGAIAEVFVGTELMKAQGMHTPHALFCWCNEEKNRQAEVDYIVQKGDQIIPIEVKAGRRGAMQSMRVFMELKKLSIGVRTAMENFSQYEKIKVYPLYAIANLVNKQIDTD